VTYLQRISGDESNVDDVRPIDFHGVDEGVLPLDAVLTNHSIAAVQMKPQFYGQCWQAPYIQQTNRRGDTNWVKAGATYLAPVFENWVGAPNTLPCNTLVLSIIRYIGWCC